MLGKGWEADPATTVVLDRMVGNGEDTFSTILKNMIIVKRIGGDSFAEIIRDDKGILLNIKPLDPASIQTILDARGMVLRYEQISKLPNKPVKKFKPTQILHFANNRVADEGLGISDVEAMEKIIDAGNEAFQDMRTLMHRYVVPKFLTYLETNDEDKIDNFTTLFNTATNNRNNLFLPMGSSKTELLAVPPNATLNSLPWMNFLGAKYFEVVGIPIIILGGQGAYSEASSKIAYLAFQQSIEDEQLYIEQQIWQQLYMQIKLTFPASLQNEMLSDEDKDGAESATSFQPSDTTAGVGR